MKIRIVAGALLAGVAGLNASAAEMTELEAKTGLIRRFLERNAEIDAIERELRAAGTLTDSVLQKLEDLKI